MRDAMRGAAGPLLSVTHVDANYGPIRVLHGVSLDVHAGEIVAIIGANGAGKTTLLRAISGVVPTKGGEIAFEGATISGRKAEDIVRCGISHVPERRELFASMTVRENLELGAYHRRRHTPRDLLQQELRGVWEVFPILRVRGEQKAGTLSGGEQQMLAIARGLMAHPKLLLLDEPSLGLAPLLVQEILRVVRVLREMGRTVLLVEQNANGALQIADRAYLMEVGRIVLAGTTQELLRDDRVRRAYLGQRVVPPLRRQTASQSSRADRVRAPRPPRKEGSASMSTYAGPSRLGQDPTFTLPDAYFMERVGATAEQLASYQDRVLPQVVASTYERSAFYHAKLSAAGVTPDAVKGLNDLARLPFTTSDEIRPSPTLAQTSERLLAVSREATTLVHTSSGTTGSPKIFAYTGRDIMAWAANAATVFWINGFRKGDIVMGAMPFGEFTGGGGLYLGMLCLGATYLPVSLGPGIADKVMAHLLGQIRINSRAVTIDPMLRANGLLTFSSFLSRLEDMLEAYGARPDELSLTKIGCGAEPSSDAVRLRIAERFGIWPRDNYGLGEFYGPGVAGECEAGGGLHVLSDAFIAEVVDPDTGDPTPEGQMGELVLTSLVKEAMPLLRYRTGDRVMALPQTCPCGCAHTWVGRVPGRISADDIVLPGGTVIHRTYLEDILLHVDGIGAEYALTVMRHPAHGGSDRLHILIEGDDRAAIGRVIVRRIRVEYDHTPVVTVVPRGSLPRATGKAQRILSPEAYRALLRECVHEDVRGH